MTTSESTLPNSQNLDRMIWFFGISEESSGGWWDVYDTIEYDDWLLSHFFDGPGFVTFEDSMTVARCFSPQQCYPWITA